MKSIALVLTLVLTLALSALTAQAQLIGFLERQWTEGPYRYCKYTNGVIITIKSVELCPLSTQG